MRFLEYMGFVLAVFPLKYGFIIVQVIVVLWFSKVYGLYPYTLENHSTADLYYDATTQTLGSASPTTSTVLYYAAEVYFHTP